MQILPTDRDVLFDLTGIRYVNYGKRELPIVANKYQAWAMMTCFFLYANYYTYNNDLNFGIGPCLIEFIHVLLFMIVFNSIMSELITLLPNAGGANGFVRHAFGLLPAFICGVFEFIDVLLCHVFSSLMWCQYACLTFNLIDSEGNYDSTAMVYLGAINLTFFCLLFTLTKPNQLWSITLALVALNICIILINLFGAMVHGNFQQNAHNWNDIIVFDDDYNQKSRRLSRLIEFTDVTIPTGFPTGYPTSVPSSHPEQIWFIGRFSMGFFKSLSNNHWCFLGIEFSSLIAGETIDVQQNIPVSLAMATTTQYVLFITSVFANVSLLGLSALGTAFPLVESLVIILNLSQRSVYGIACIGVLIVQIAYFFCLSRMIFHLSRKGLMPEILSRTHNDKPVTAVVAASVFGFAIHVLMSEVDHVDFVNVTMTLLTVSGISVVSLITSAFIVLRLKFPLLARPFRSPFGLSGGIFALITCILLLISNCLKNRANVPLIFYTIIVCVLAWSIYFFFVTKRFIVIDEDEKKAIVADLNFDSILMTEFGYQYLENHCVREHNCESVHCIMELRQFFESKNLPVENLKQFISKFIIEDAVSQVNIPDKLRNQIIQLTKDGGEKDIEQQDSEQSKGRMVRSHSAYVSKKTNWRKILQLLDKELLDLINMDIIPRWKSNEEALERFLTNNPPERRYDVYLQ